MSQARPRRELRIHSGGANIRTLADGLEQLCRLESRLSNRKIILKVSPLRLPTGELTASIALTIPKIAARTTLAFVLPAAAHVYATGTLGLRQRYESTWLNGAVVDMEGNVGLKNGTHLHNIELMPTTLRPELSMRQEKILFAVVRVLQAWDRCVRAAHQDLLEQVRWDYAALSKERLPTLKELEWQVYKFLPGATRHEIANTLTVAGMRKPRSGRHANASPPAAS